MTERSRKDRNLAMEAVRVTEAAALAASRFLGRGDEQAADIGARDAMHQALATLDIDGVVRVGEGKKAEAEKLFIGETVGSGAGPSVSVGLLPLEGPTIIARGEPNGISVIAMAESGGILQVPPLYMEKIAVGCGLPSGVVSLDAEPADNLEALAEAKGTDVSDLVVCTLDRPRHADLIGKIRDAGARILLIGDGDVSGVIATTQPTSGVDLFVGIGGAREGVLAAAALACIGGQMQARLMPRTADDKVLAKEYGIAETDKLYSATDMAWGDVTFAATGVTGGTMLRGVGDVRGCPVTHSMVMRSATGAMRYIEAHHDFAREAAPAARL